MKKLFTVLAAISIMGCITPAEAEQTETDVNSKTADILSGTENEEEKLEAIFYFVRDEIEFNWIYPQDISVEEVINNSYGVCMQKANLFSAMAREAGFETRFHFIYVHKNALEDFLPAYAFNNWVDPFPHTVTEVKINGRWVSFDPSFDRELHEICIRNNLNFGRYPQIAAEVPTEFSINGMKGAQEFFRAENTEDFYGDDLSPLMEFDKQNVPFFKRLLKPLIFKQAHSIMDEIRAGR